MKRLQFRHEDSLFESRELANKFLESIVDVNQVNCTNFGESLFAEPLAVKYADESGDTQIILAIGTDSGHTPYHIIDTADIYHKFYALKDYITLEAERIGNVESSITSQIANVNTLSNVLFGHKGAIGYIDGHLVYSDNDDEDVEYLYFVSTNKEGTTSLIGVDFEEYITTSEIGSGLQVINEKVAVKIADDSEEYITVTEDGIKIQGVDKAISLAVANSAVQIKSITPSSSAIKSSYALQDISGNTLGDTIDIKVESALSDVIMGHLGGSVDPTTGSYTDGTGDDTLNFIYKKEDGTFKLVPVVVSKYFTDAHFGRGLKNQDGVVSLNEGDGNEYLVIGDDTISVIGVNAAISGATKSAIEEAKENTKEIIYEELVTDGIPVTDISIEDAKQHSLIREVSINGERRYYVSNKATDMLYEKADGTFVELNSYIANIEERLKNIEDNFTSKVLSALSSTMQGTANEIAVTHTASGITIGFTDDAIFGEE